MLGKNTEKCQSKSYMNGNVVLAGDPVFIGLVADNKIYLCYIRI